MSSNKKSSVNLTTRQKSSWLELTIEDGNTKIVTSVWLDELKSLKENLEEVIYDINCLIEKHQ
jgi:hypothetical protein